jgi:hypothetical protein
MAERTVTSTRFWTRLVPLAVLAGALVFGATAPAGATSRHATPLVDAGCFSPGVAKPTKITLACADGNAVLEHLHWSAWGSQTAQGSGVMDQNDCTPDCAAGVFKTYPVKVALSRPVPADGRRYFVVVKVNFTSKATPAGKRTESMSDCFVNPPKAYVPRCPANLPA